MKEAESLIKRAAPARSKKGTVPFSYHPFQVYI